MKAFVLLAEKVEFLHKLVVDLYVAHLLLHNVTAESFSWFVAEADA